MELFVDFFGCGGTPVFGSSLKDTIMKRATINNNTIDCSSSLNDALLSASALNNNISFINTALNKTTLNNTVMDNSTFICTPFTNATLTNSSLNDSSFNSNSLNSTAKNSSAFIGSAQSTVELNRNDANGQHPTEVAANGSVFPRMRSELDESPAVSYPSSSELDPITPSSSLLPFPTDRPCTATTITGKRRAAAATETTSSTPLKPPKKYRGPGEDREIKRCKRSLSFIRGSSEDVIDGSEGASSPPRSEEKKTGEKTSRPRASVERRNKRERIRVKQINNTFVTLRNQIPSDGWSAKRNAKKFSKVDTLRMAIEYIRGLRQLITDHDAMFMSAEYLALLSSPQTTTTEEVLLGDVQSPYSQHLSSLQQRTCFMVNGGDSGSDRSGAESVGSSSTSDLPSSGPPSSSSYPSSSSSSSLSSSTASISDFFPPLGSNLSEDLLDAFLADMYMHAS